jgi:hypothetical protein
MPFTEVCLPLQALCAATVNGHEDGDALITASDGESRTIKAGDVIALSVHRARLNGGIAKGGIL